MIQNSYNDTPSLYLIPTPIGNLDDMTYRAVKVLEEVEVIFSEDTRVTLNLLNNFGIKKKLISLHEHNEDILKEKVLEYLKNGYSVGLVTDRGTPIIVILDIKRLSILVIIIIMLLHYLELLLLYVL